MESYDIGRLGYLLLLAFAVGGWLLVEHRGRLGAALRQAMAWALIFLGVVAGYGLWSDIRHQLAPQQAILTDGSAIEVPRAPNGHYYLTLTVGGTPLRFMVDTGATNIVLSNDDADRIGIDRNTLAFVGQAHTANGLIRTARVQLEDVALEGLPQDRLPAWVGDGRLEVSLLGMDFLNRFSRVEIARDRLILTP